MADVAQPPRYLRRNQVQIVRIIGRLRDPRRCAPVGCSHRRTLVTALRELHYSALAVIQRRYKGKSAPGSARESGFRIVIGVAHPFLSLSFSLVGEIVAWRPEDIFHALLRVSGFFRRINAVTRATRYA